jgi:hypothetical protein
MRDNTKLREFELADEVAILIYSETRKTVLSAMIQNF